MIAPCVKLWVTDFSQFLSFYLYIQCIYIYILPYIYIYIQGPNSRFGTASHFLPKILFHPSPPPPKKNHYLNFDRRVRWDTTLIRRIKLKLRLHTPISVTDFCRNGIAMSMGGEYSKEISVAWYVTHADLSRNDHCDTNRWRKSVCVNKS